MKKNNGYYEDVKLGAGNNCETKEFTFRFRKLVTFSKTAFGKTAKRQEKAAGVHTLYADSKDECEKWVESFRKVLTADRALVEQKAFIVVLFPDTGLTASAPQFPRIVARIGVLTSDCLARVVGRDTWTQVDFRPGSIR